MKAKLKHPKLWAVIWNEDGDIVHASLKKPSRKWKDSNGEKVSVLCYHLHPGNEVARAMNILRSDVWYYDLNTTDKDVAATLRDNGIPVRWDAKKGRFV